MDDQKYVLSVKLIGVMHKESVKLYITSVLWSDQKEIVVYRAFKDFKDLNKKLKKRFPPVNPLMKSNRVVPKFKVKKAKRNGPKKSPSKSLLKMKSLEGYCNELISCDRVAQTVELRQFFLPSDEELDSNFGKNSIVIMPSEDTLNEGEGNVTQPFVTETYRCVAPYETKDTKNRPFKVDVDELVDVLIKDKAGWWMVENEAKCMAWFPAPYLEKMDADLEDATDDNDGGVLYCPSRTYKARSADELSVGVGDVVEVLQKSENGWWLVRHNRKTGYIPSMYLSPYTHPRVQLLTNQRNLRGSALNLATLQAPHTQQLSRSQGNLLQLPGLGSQPPVQGLNPQDRYKSRSLNLESDSDIYQRPSNIPSIQVDPEPVGRRQNMGSEESESREGSEFSFSNDSSTSGTDSLNLSCSSIRDELQRSRTPPPPSRESLSPDSSLDGRLQLSRSDPNLSKNPTMPKVPPRPRTQEILTRCTTVTRKNIPLNQQEANEDSIQSR